MAKQKSLPTRSKDIPATLGMLQIVRDELKSEMTSGFLRIDARFEVVTSDITTLKSDVSALKSDVSALKSDVSALKSDVSALKSDVSTLKSDVSELKSSMSGVRVDMLDLKLEMAKMATSMHQMKLLAEEQRAENRIVMDGLTSLFSRQDRVESRVDSFEKSLADLKR